MLKKIKIQIKGIHCKSCKTLIETEVDILKGIKHINVDHTTGQAEIEFDDDKISKEKIFAAIEKLDYRVNKMTHFISNIKEQVYFVRGAHCASCEIILEKGILLQKGVEAVDVSAGSGRVVIAYEGVCPSKEKLNKIFKKNGYSFFDQKIKSNSNKILTNKRQLKNSLITFSIPLIFIIIFIFLYKSGLSAIVSVNSKSSLFIFLLFGVLAGLSSCAALVGGIVLSMSKQWLEMYKKDDTIIHKLQPHFLFNIGRLVSYGVLGATLGLIGNALQLSLTFTAVLTFAVSVLMIFLSFQMLGVRLFQKFQIGVPKFVTRYIADESNFKGQYMPFIIGALTFFLPCGFTITAQGLALASGSIIQGGLIMLFFALGTTPILLGIGLSSVKFSQKPHMAAKFLKIAGALVLFFALFNINAQLNVLGFRSLSDIDFGFNGSKQILDNDLPKIVNGKQIVKMDALSYKYEPSKIKVRVGVPVRWEITDIDSSGCTNAVMSRGLFDGEISLEKGKTSIKEFTPEKVGKYKFSCWMGMVSGIIEVVDENSDSSALIDDYNNDDDIISSGAAGCGCGKTSCSASVK